MSDALRRLPIATEMDTLQAEIGCDQRLMSGRQAQDGAVIPDSECHFGIFHLPDVSQAIQKMAFRYQSSKGTR